MKEHDKQLAHLRRLAEGLSHRGFAANITQGAASVSLRVANPDTPALNERVLCRPADDGSWWFWWTWRQPIGSVDEQEVVIRKIATVLRSVEGDAPSAHHPGITETPARIRNETVTHNEHLCGNDAAQKRRL